MQIKTTTKYTSYPLDSYNKKKSEAITSVVEKLETSYTAVKNVKCIAALENRLVVPQKIKHKIII